MEDVLHIRIDGELKASFLRKYGKNAASRVRELIEGDLGQGDTSNTSRPVIKTVEDVRKVVGQGVSVKHSKSCLKWKSDKDRRFGTCGC